MRYRENQGFTLVEALVAGLLLVVAVGAAWTVLVHLAAVDTGEAGDQEYDRLIVRLGNRLRDDLRSADELIQESEGHYRLRVIRFPAGGRPQPETVTWRLDTARRTVTRSGPEGETVYDFAAHCGDLPFVFELVRADAADR